MQEHLSFYINTNGIKKKECTMFEQLEIHKYCSMNK